MTLEKHYTFKTLEAKHAKSWEADNNFAPNMEAAESFAIMMPPPNVTGTLHLGHALDNTLPDMLVRRARMQGKAALYQPGTDHASIAVHVVLERQFREEAQEGKLTRFDFGREKFMERAWKWKDESHAVITNQMRRLGISCDWGNERFTMDEAYSAAVTKVFVELHKRGLIYRGQRLVNWDPVMQTAVSDLEVGHKEVEGNLWHFKYPFTEEDFTYEGEDGISIATTRPETILADGAIAINPKDPRAKDLVGKMVNVPIVNRAIPIIADDYVDPEFGSGMVKITAAHDFNDFEVYKRHKDSVNIPLINLMNPDATMNENCPADYQGLDRFEARKKVIADFTEMGLFIKAVPHMHQVPTAERDSTILEPYLTQQWYVKGAPLAKKCLAAADSGDLQFVNTRDEKVYRHWLNNIEDWCISRQLWWGHRLPVWYKDDETYVGETAPEDSGWTQDKDILDTWFSSALWPFVTQGWPEESDAQTGRVKKFYPGALINSGRDILFFWLVRMVMMGTELMNEVPFGKIYTHGLILDEHGHKMSKSKGNVVNPLDMMDKYGADALRLTMANIASHEDMKFSEQKVEQSRNFCTKLWNAARYMEMKEISITEDVPIATHPVNQWLLSELNKLIKKYDEHIEKYEFNQATQKLYHFVWGTWCDWYLELTKPLLANDETRTETENVMGYGFGVMLKVLHPTIPFMTEELWQNLGGAEKLIIASWPNANLPEVETDVPALQNIITAIRIMRGEMNVPNKAQITLYVKTGDAQLLENNRPLLAALANVEAVKTATNEKGNTDALIVTQGMELLVPLAGIVDFAAEAARIEKEMAKAQAELEKIKGLLGNESFIARAPASVVAENKTRAAELEESIAKLKTAT